MKTYIAAILANIPDAQCSVNEETGKITGWHGANQPTDAQVQAWYAAYQEPVPPISVSPRQIRQALTAVGLRAQVEAAVASGSQDLKDWWEFSTAIEENHPEVLAMATAMGLTAEQRHDLFVLAGGL